MMPIAEDKITFFRKRIEKELDALDIKKEPATLYEPFRYTLSLGGKRMRPVLLMMSHQLFDDREEEAIPAALAIEVFHNFTLVHDDIMDNAPLRRNKPTVHEKWNRNTALLSGDAMLVYAYKLLSGYEDHLLKDLFGIFNETAFLVCEGQQLDMDFERQDKVTIAEYIDMISRKTAALLAGSMEIGAVLGGASRADRKNIYNFALKTGIAFQLQDDILDVYGSPEKFGKQPGGDIIANKKTYLLLKAFEIADEKQKALLETLMASNEKKEKVDAVTHIYNELKIRASGINEMQSYFNQALSHLSSVNAPENKKDALKKYAEKLMVREV